MKKRENKLQKLKKQKEQMLGKAPIKAYVDMQPVLSVIRQFDLTLLSAEQLCEANQIFADLTKLSEEIYKEKAKADPDWEQGTDFDESGYS